MRIALGVDHGGFSLREPVLRCLQQTGHEVLDFGARAYVADDDYPDFARAVGRAVAQGEAERGILICGSGVGVCVAANKIPGVRACLCHDTYSARQGVEHDGINVLCLGGRVIGDELARELVRAFLGVEFSGSERHQRRLDKVIAIERGEGAE